MHLILSNPAGLWALMAVPVLVLIHFLQRQSRRIEITTMFLIDRLEVESRAGRRLERWRNSRLFWLQILAVLLIAWMLCAPRWVDSGSLQRIALVLDSSLAMEAFRPGLQNGLDRDTSTLARGANRTEWFLLESDVTQPPLYRGEDRSALMAAVAKWHANLGPHDADPVLRAARVAVGNEGLVLFVTYHKPAESPLPVEAHALSYGHPLDNVGVAAATAEMHEGQPLWRMLVRNYATTPQRRTWWIEANNQRSPPQTIQLEAGGSQALQGAFPAGADHLVFAFEPDDFTLDDRVPLVLPQPKILTVAFHETEDFATYLKPVLPIIGNTVSAVAGEPADFVFDLGGNLTGTPEGTTRVYFSAQPENAAAATLHAHPAPENHPLMDGLNWSGLLYTPLDPIPPRPEDTTLIWDGANPLVFLRESTGQGKSLIINFDPRQSNLTHLPAFVLLVHRFAELARSNKPAFERANYPSGESLSPVLAPGAKAAHLEVSPPNTTEASKAVPQTTALATNATVHIHTPSPPAFFTIKVDDKVWLDAAAQFPDPRESDFHDAVAIPLDSHAQLAREEAHSHPDALTPLWVLSLLGALLASWRETGKHLK